MQDLYPQAFVWMERLIALAVALQTVELLQIRASFSENGIWAWQTLRREFEELPWIFRVVLDWTLGEPGFPAFLSLRLIFALLAPFLISPWIWAFLLASTVLIAVRWRGTFNGGSDYMTIIVLTAALVGRALGGDLHPRFISFGSFTAISLGYVGLQVSLSFFVAGVVKLRRSEWRSGEALLGFLNSEAYGVPNWVKRKSDLFKKKGWARLGAWGVLGFECLFPLALLDSRACLALIFLALGFQLINSFVFGLNRFFWAWGSAYPALYWCSLYLSRGR